MTFISAQVEMNDQHNGRRKLLSKKAFGNSMA